MVARRIAMVMIAAGAILAGCGGDDTSSGKGGKGADLFKSTCGTCHTLSAAGTNGSVGPNLDDLQPDESRVQAMIASGGGGMPGGLVSGADADAIAAYVAENAGK